MYKSLACLVKSGEFTVFEGAEGSELVMAEPRPTGIVFARFRADSFARW